MSGEYKRNSLHEFKVQYSMRLKDLEFKLPILYRQLMQFDIFGDNFEQNILI